MNHRHPMAAVLFHVSEEPGISRFEPRPPPPTAAGISGNVAWAIDSDHLPNYLLPRDCPRVTYRAGPRTTAADRDRFFPGPGARGVIALEAGWHERIAGAQLYVYELPASAFRLHDAIAGYHVSPETVVPSNVIEVSDPLAAIRARDIELRFLPEIWPLHDAVAASSLDFSIIRMRNAQPRGATPASWPASR